jgi:hypothetical protein
MGPWDAIVMVGFFALCGCALLIIYHSNRPR